MPSINPKFSYDIFISYRQKDNKGDHWVTEFVDALKNELESTFKEEISVYFDINPHDGLLENHQVDASLKEKLKCLVFIPIISRTYCDPKSFAWQHEFVAFNQASNSDGIGRDVKLHNGNVASRILPVRIHELDATDLKMLEGELAGPLRPIDFIFKSTGINRPLRPAEENPKENLNHTSFRDQINKVANAVKEIVTAIQSNDGSLVTPSTTKSRTSILNPEPRTPPALRQLRRAGRNKIYFFAGAILLAAAFFVLLPDKLFKSDSSQYDYDVSVMYIENFTDNPKYGDELASLIHINLAQDTGLHLLPRQKLFDGMKEATGEAGPPDKGHSSEIARKTGTRTMLTGSVHMQGAKALVQLELIEVATGKILKAEKLEGKMDEIFALADKISTKFSEPTFKREFNVSVTTTGQYDAYQKYHNGLEDLWAFRFPEARANFQKAIEIDSTFAMAYMYRSMVTISGGMNPLLESETALKLSEKSRKYSYKVSPHDRKLINANYNMLIGNHKESRDLALAAYNENRDERASLMMLSWPSSILGDEGYPDILEDYLVRNPSDGLSHNHAAYVAANRGEFAKAEEHVRRYIALEPKNTNTYHSGWETCMMAGDEAKALTYLKQWKVSPRAMGNMMAFHNIAMARPEELSRLYNAFKDSVATPTGFPSFQAMNAFARILSGQFNNAISDFNIAEEKFRKAKDATGRLTVSLFKGLSLTYMHRTKEANITFDKIIRESSAELKDFNPFGALSCYHAAIAEARAGNIEQANRRLHQFDSLAPSQHSAWLLKSYRDFIEVEIALARGDYDQASKKLESHHGWFGTQAAYMYPSYMLDWKKGNFDKAVGALIPFQKNILWARFYNGGNSAVFAMERTFAEYNAGRISEDAGKKQEAVKYYKMFLERFKDADKGIAEKEDAEKRLKGLSISPPSYN